MSEEFENAIKSLAKNLTSKELLDYQIFVEEIRFTKNQIWQTVYLTILAFSGIIALGLICKTLVNLLLGVAVILIWFLSSKTLKYHNFSIEDYRYLRNETRKLLIEEEAAEKEKIKNNIESKLIERNKPQDLFFKNLFLIIISIAAALSILVLLVVIT